jgi:Tol biopolymer transport system component
VFSAERNGNADLWTWDPATDAVTRHLRAPGDQHDPAWAPDGSAVVYRDGPGLHMVTADGDPYDPPDFTHHGQDRHPAWSPDGETVVFATDRNPFTSLDLATRLADDNEADLVRLTDDDADDWDPQWSPDGRQIVFVSTRDDHQHLWLMDADGGREREIRLGAGIYDDPMFSPDGEWLGFTRRDEDTKKALYVARVDGSEMRRLTSSDATEADLAWSPDGSIIAVVRDDDAGQIVLVDVASATEIGSFGVDDARNRAPDWWWPPE